MSRSKRSILSIVAILLTALIAATPVFSAFNGTGGLGARPSGVVKAWYNPGTDEGYRVQLFCCQVLGNAGHSGAVWTDYDALIFVDEVYVMGTPHFHDSAGNHDLMGSDCIVDPAIRAWGSNFKGTQILDMFDDLGIDHILSWFYQVNTRLKVRNYLRNTVGTFYLDAEMQYGIPATYLDIPLSTNQVGDLDKINWYIHIEPFVVFRGLGPSSNEWAALTCWEISEKQGYDYNFLSNTHDNCGYDYHWISETGLPNNYSYKHTATPGYKEVYTGGLPGEAVQSIAYSMLPNSLFFTESWFGEDCWYDTHATDPTAYWSLYEVSKFGGRGWLSMEGAEVQEFGTPELSMVELIAGDGIDTVTLDDYRVGRDVHSFYGGENGYFGEFTFSAAPGRMKLVKLYQTNPGSSTPVLVTNRNVYYAFYGEDGEDYGLFHTGPDGVSDRAILLDTGYYYFYFNNPEDDPDLESFASTYFDIESAPENAWICWKDEYGNVWSADREGTADVPLGGGVYTAYAGLSLVPYYVGTDDDVISVTPSSGTVEANLTPLTNLDETVFWTTDGTQTFGGESNWSNYDSEHITASGTISASAPGGYVTRFTATGAYDPDSHTMTTTAANVEVSTVLGTPWSFEITGGSSLATVERYTNAGHDYLRITPTGMGAGAVQVRVYATDTLPGLNPTQDATITVSVTCNHLYVDRQWEIRTQGTLSSPYPATEYETENGSETSTVTGTKTVTLELQADTGISSVGINGTQNTSVTCTLTRDVNRARTVTVHKHRSITYVNLRFYGDPAHTILLGHVGDTYDATQYPTVYPVYDSISYGQWVIDNTVYGEWYDIGYGVWSTNTDSISATVASGYTFTIWTVSSGDAPASATNASTTVNHTQNTVLVAHAIRNDGITVNQNNTVTVNVRPKTALRQTSFAYTGTLQGGQSNWSDYDQDYISATGDISAIERGNYTVTFGCRNIYNSLYQTKTGGTASIPITTLSGSGWTAEIISGSNLITLANNSGTSGSSLSVFANETGAEGDATVRIRTNAASGWKAETRDISIHVVWNRQTRTYNWSIGSPVGTLYVPELPGYEDRTETETEQNTVYNDDTYTATLTLQKDNGIATVGINGTSATTLDATAVRHGTAVVERTITYSYQRTLAYTNIQWYAIPVGGTTPVLVGVPGDTYLEDDYEPGSFTFTYEIDQNACGPWALTGTQMSAWSDPDYTYGDWIYTTVAITAQAAQGHMFAGWTVVEGDAPANPFTTDTMVVLTQDTTLRAISSAYDFSVNSVAFDTYSDEYLDGYRWAGDTVSVTVTVRNNSTFAFSNVPFSLNVDGTPVALSGTDTVIMLTFGAGETKTLTINGVVLPAAASGSTVTRTVTAWINEAHRNEELNPNNNSGSKSVLVTRDFTAVEIIDPEQGSGVAEPCYNAGETIAFDFSTNSQNPNNDSTTGKVYYNGSQVDEFDASYTGTGDVTIPAESVHSVSIPLGDVYGTKTIRGIINPDGRSSERNPDDNETLYTIHVGHNLGITPVVSNGRYTAGTTVITSFRVHNWSPTVPILPSAGVSVRFTVKIEGLPDIVQTWNNIGLPGGANGDEAGLVYFKWAVPEEAAEKSIDITAELIIPSSIPDFIPDDNTATLTTAGGATAYAGPDASQTVNPGYEDKKPDGFTEAVPPQSENASASWWEWKYDESAGTFSKVTYGISLSQNTAVITPDTDCKTATLASGIWTMRSGYGITLVASIPVCSNGNLTVPAASAYTTVQTAIATFPEFRFGTESGLYRVLEKIDLDGDGKKEFTFVLNPNADDPAHDRLHFTPVWYPDGVENYTVAVISTNCWTPQMTSENTGTYVGGMLTSVQTSNRFSIDGSIYDDWYIGY